MQPNVWGGRKAKEKITPIPVVLSWTKNTETTEQVNHVAHVQLA